MDDSIYAPVTCDVASAAGTDPVALALATDIDQCSAALEDAYFASTSSAAVAALAVAAQWMRRAQNNAGGVADENLASRAACIAVAIEAASTACSTAVTPAALATVQDAQIRPIQGQLVGLGGVALAHDSIGTGYAFLGILLPIVTIYGVAVVSSAQKSRAAR